jgi:hypothetical protein
VSRRRLRGHVNGHATRHQDGRLSPFRSSRFGIGGDRRSLSGTERGRDREPLQEGTRRDERRQVFSGDNRLQHQPSARFHPWQEEQDPRDHFRVPRERQYRHGIDEVPCGRGTVGSGRVGETMLSTTEQSKLILERLRALLPRALAIPVVAYEEEVGEALIPLLDDAKGCVHEAIACFDATLALFDQPAPFVDDFDFEPPSQVSQALDDLVSETSTRAGERVSNTAFIGRIGLLARSRQLQALQPEPQWELVSTCGRALREVYKATSAVELVLSEELGERSGVRHFVTELQHSIRTRHAYWAFRRDVLASTPPTISTIYGRLRSASNAIAKLAGRESYAVARFDDRLQIRGFHQRIRAHLHEMLQARHDGNRIEALEIAGMRLWQDLANLCDLIMQVNQRAELRQHDRALLQDSIDHLDNITSAMLVERLRPLRGRDGELDAWLEAPRDIETLKRTATRILTELGQMPGHPSPRRFSSQKLRQVGHSMRK